MPVPPARLLFFASTAGGIALGVKSLVGIPPPLWLSLTALLGYLAILICGVIFSRFSMFADVVTSGPRNARGVALTFDDGPDPATTPAVLAALERADAVATFFVIGRKVEQHPELLRDVAKRGHAIGLHSYAHERLFSLRSPWYVRRDLERCIGEIQRVCGLRPTIYRAPIGHVSPAMARVCRQLGLQVVGWSARGVDGWSGAKPGKVAARVVRAMRDGSILLLHDAAERDDFRPASIDALPEILAAAKRLQLEFVRVDSWLGDGAVGERDAHDPIPSETTSSS